MPDSNATDAIIEMARSFEDVVEGTSCNQTSFKVAKKAILFIGPGAKGVGHKAMFKLQKSIPQAMTLAEKTPDRIQVGSNCWVTTRFTDDKPLAKTIWTKWLKESWQNAYQ